MRESASVRKNLSAAVMKACTNNENLFKEALRKNRIEFAKASDNVAKLREMMSEIRKEYLTKVFDDIIQDLSESVPSIDEKVKTALANPSICGISEREVNDEIMAGTIYAICYWAITDKRAKPKDCTALTRFQDEVMFRMIRSVDLGLIDSYNR